MQTKAYFANGHRVVWMYTGTSFLISCRCFDLFSFLVVRYELQIKFNMVYHPLTNFLEVSIMCQNDTRSADTR